MVMGGDSGGGGGTVVANAPTVTNPDKVSNSDAASAIASAKNQVANAVSPTDPNNNATAQTPTQTTTTTTDGKVPTAADAVLSISASTPVKQTLIKNTLGAGQAL